MVTVSKQSTNGLPVPLATSGQRSALTPPRIERWLDVPDYPGYKVKLWINYPKHLKSAFEPPDLGAVEGLDEAARDAYVAERQAAIEGALAAIVLEHNGWPDADGNVLPQPSDPKLWEMDDQHLTNVVMLLAFRAPSELPNSLAPTRRR